MLSPYNESGEPAPTIATGFDLVEIGVRTPQLETV